MSYTRFRSVFMMLASLVPMWGMAQSAAPDTADYPYWIEMMQDPQANFFETQRAFNTYWEGRTIEKGSGWKVFKRWEALMEPRVHADGTLPDPAEVRDGYQAFRAVNAGSRSTIGNWTEVGPITMPTNGTGQPNGLGRLNNICFHPTDANTIWVGAPAGGLWKTTDGGTTWSSNTDDLPTLGVSSILVDPTNTDVMYIGTGDRDGGDAPGLGVYKSVDGGLTWAVSNTNMGNKTVGAMVMHPTNSAIIVAATNDGVWKTTNSGLTWTMTSSNTQNYKDIRYQPGSSSIMYTTAQGDFYRSTNGGDSWTQITSGLSSSSTRMVIGVSPDDANYVYLLSGVGSTFEGFYRSTDAGLNFTQMSNSPNILTWDMNGSGTGGQAWYDLCLAVDPLDADIVYTGGVNIWKSIDGGATWEISAHWVGNATVPSVHADHHWLEYSPVNGRLYNCNDGGIHYTENGGDTWPEISSGLAIAQIYRIGQAATELDLVMNGYQDNGSAVFDGAWRTEMGGDGMECIVDPTDGNYIYGSIYFGRISRSTNNGYNFGVVAGDNVNGISESGAWITPYILHQDDPNTMFVGYKNVWRSTNVKAGSGVSFTQISSNLAGNNSQNMRDMKQSRANSDVLYAARHDSKLFRTDDCMAANPTWIDLSGNMPNNADVIDIETHPYQAGTVYIIQSNNVYRSTNYGNTWTDITGNLPTGFKGCMVIDPYSHEGLYVGTDAGVYYTDSTLSNWVAFDNGMPATARINELEIYYETTNFDGSRMRAATYGRGLWSGELYDPGTNAPLANFFADIDEASLCDMDTVTLGDYTAYGPTSWTWTITPNTVTYVNGTNFTSQVPQLVFNEAGDYDIQLVVSNANGSDSIFKAAHVSVSAGVPLTYLEDFETFADCGTNNCTKSCPVELDWRNRQNGTEDDIDWRPHAGTTPSGTTGPSMDFNPGTSSGKYLYTEASFCFNQEALLESPCIDLSESTSSRMRFAYYMDGFSMGEMHFDVKHGGVWDQDVEPFKTGDLGPNWLQDSIDLVNYEGESVRIRFRGITGPNYSSDMAIDDIGVVGGPLVDFEADDATPCLNQTVVLTNLTTLNPTTINWTITPNTFTYVNGTNQNSVNPEVEFQAEDTYTVTLDAANQYGASVETKTAYIVVDDPNATLESSEDDLSLCAGDLVTFTAPAGYDNYTFIVNDVLLQSGSQNTYSSSILFNGSTVYVTITDTNNCVGTTQPNPLVMTVYPLPQPLLSSSDSDDEICEGDSITFTETQGAVEYLFFADSSLVQQSTADAWSTTTLQDGQSVYAQVIDSNGCTNVTTSITTVVLQAPATPIISLNNATDSLIANPPGGVSYYNWYLDGTLLPQYTATIPWSGYGIYSVIAHGADCSSDTAFFDWGSNSYFDPANTTDSDLRVFPNPSRGSFTVELDGFNTETVRVLVSDAAGRLVFDREVAVPGGQLLQYDIDLRGAGTGVFELEVRSGSESRVQKLLFVQ